MAELPTFPSIQDFAFGRLDLLKLAALISAAALYASPMPEMREVDRTGQLGDRSFFPYAALWISSAFWVVYGFLTKDFFPVVATNLFGLLLSTSYCNTFVRHAPRPELHGRAMRLYALCIAIACVFSGYCLVTQDDRSLVITRAGVLASAFNVIQYASPLAQIRQVFRRRSSASMSFALTIAGVACSALWALYGLLQGDVFQWAPNVLGLIAALLQVLLFIVFPSVKSHSESSLVKASRSESNLAKLKGDSAAAAVELGLANRGDRATVDRERDRDVVTTSKQPRASAIGS